MLEFLKINLNKIIVHRVGNKSLGGVKNTITGNVSTFAIVYQEPKLRNGFYTATNLVDKTINDPKLTSALKAIGKINEAGNFRADLINYVTDGTAPSNYKEGMSTEQKSIYNQAVKAIGNKILKTKNYPIPKN